MAGWISVDRDMLESKLFSRSGNHVKICLYILLSANHKDRFHRGIEIKRGQCVRSFTQIEHACSVTRKAVRCAFENMIKDDFIKTSEPFGARKGHMITVCNYETYQSSEHREGHAGAKEVPSKVHSKSHKQEGNKEKNTTSGVNDIRLQSNVSKGTGQTHTHGNSTGGTGKDISDVFLQRFNQVTGKKFRVVSGKVKGQLKARLKEGFTMDEIIGAAEICKETKHHVENPKYLTPEFITRLDKLQMYCKDVSGDSFTPFRQNGKNILGEGLCNGLTRTQFIEKHGRVA